MSKKVNVYGTYGMMIVRKARKENPRESPRTMFEVGQEVVCIDDSPARKDGVKELIKGQRYIIRWIGMWKGSLYTEEKLCVRLEGMYRDESPLVRGLVETIKEFAPDDETYDWDSYWKDIPFRASRFRPIQKKKTDIGELQKLLLTNKELIDVQA